VAGPTELVDGRWTTARCLSEQCGAPIVWARTPGGKNTPVDVQVSPAGTILLVDRGDRVPVAVVLKPDDRADHAGKLRTTHWATCPAAPAFRSSR
jgi:hypothetical protein